MRIFALCALMLTTCIAAGASAEKLDLNAVATGIGEEIASARECGLPERPFRHFSEAVMREFKLNATQRQLFRAAVLNAARHPMGLFSCAHIRREIKSMAHDGIH